MATATDVSELRATHPRPSEVDARRSPMHRRVLRLRSQLHDLRGRRPRRGDVAEMRRCIRLCLDCADVCIATGRMVSRQTEYEPETTRAEVESCRQSCSTCGEECERHAQHHEHCRLCAESCRRCEAACAALLDAI